MRSMTLNLMADDARTAVDFYTSVLGFELLQRSPAAGPAVDWARLGQGDLRLMVQSRASLTAEFPRLAARTAGGALTVFIEVDDPATWWRRVEARATVVQPLGVTAYNGATEFVIVDPEGTMLHFSDLRLDQVRV